MFSEIWMYSRLCSTDFYSNTSFLLRHRQSKTRQLSCFITHKHFRYVFYFSFCLFVSSPTVLYVCCYICSVQLLLDTKKKGGGVERRGIIPKQCFWNCRNVIFFCRRALQISRDKLTQKSVEINVYGGSGMDIRQSVAVNEVKNKRRIKLWDPQTEINNKKIHCKTSAYF